MLHKIKQQKISQKIMIHVSKNCWSGHPSFLIWPRILLRLAYCEMVRPTLSMNLKSAARPLPRPDESLVQRVDIRNLHPSGDFAMSSRQVFEAPNNKIYRNIHDVCWTFKDNTKFQTTLGGKCQTSLKFQMYVKHVCFNLYLGANLKRLVPSGFPCIQALHPRLSGQFVGPQTAEALKAEMTG